MISVHWSVSLPLLFLLSRKSNFLIPSCRGGQPIISPKVAAPLWEVAPYVRDAIEMGIDAGVDVVTDDQPVCSAHSYRRADELIFPLVISLSELTFTDSNWLCSREGNIRACRGVISANSVAVSIPCTMRHLANVPASRLSRSRPWVAESPTSYREFLSRACGACRKKIRPLTVS